MVELSRGRVANERAILVGLEQGEYWQERMAELKELAISAGAEVVGEVRQRREEPDPFYYIGKGKAEELAVLIRELDADLVIVDASLNLVQHRNLENILQAKVVDRTELILDIFAQRAHTKEGKLQIELAQLTYLLPRLTGRGVFLSRLGGGIGTRGPGETKLEYDRRRIRDRINQLRKEIDEVREQRMRRRLLRRAENTPIIALVGYTNVGKSTLLNAIAKASVYVDNRPFATLDPTTRRVRLKGGGVVLFTDTVGFIRDLPPNLIAAFRATLEEVREADILLHVADGSHPKMAEQIATVNRILAEVIEVGEKKMVYAINKMDKANIHEVMAKLPMGISNVCFISALQQRGISALLEKIARILEEELCLVELVIPYDRGDVLSLLYEKGRVLGEDFLEKGINVLARVPVDIRDKLSLFATNKGKRT
ncbi:MAG: GTPase HflX [bacterium]